CAARCPSRAGGPPRGSSGPGHPGCPAGDRCGPASGLLSTVYRNHTRRPSQGFRISPALQNRASLAVALLKVGLTGGLASGKTTVAGVFRELGAAVFDADVIVKDLYRPGGEGTNTARELFGDSVLDSKGGVDRGRVALIVFQD